MSFATGRVAAARRAAKAARPKSLVPKALGNSMADKGPARNEKHLAKVRRQKCLICPHVGIGRQSTPTHTHHCRALNGGMMGIRPSDFLVVPLCAEHHLDQFPTGLHKLGEANFWLIAKSAYGVDPAAWIAQFSPEGAAEIERLRAKT